MASADHDTLHGATVGLGGASIGNHRRAITDREAREVLEAAWAAGIRHFDTAPHYGLGLSETRLGEFLADKPRHEFTVSTKVGRILEPNEEAGAWDDEGFIVPATHRRYWDFSAAGVRRSLVESLIRLGLDQVDVAYLHDPERWRLDAALQAGVPALALLREEKLTARIGVASMAVDALGAASRLPALDDIMVAGRLTILDKSASATVLGGCVGGDIDVTAAAILNGGLLAAARAENAGFDYTDPSASILERAHRISTTCGRFGVHPAAAALQFPLRFDPVRRIVIGADDGEQILQNLAWLRQPVPDELWDALESEDAGGPR